MATVNRKLIKSLLVWFVVAGFVAFVISFFSTNPERFVQFYSLSLGEIFVLVGLSLLVFLGLAIQMKLMLVPYGTQISLTVAYQLAVANNLLNYLPLKSGILGKGLYLKVRHGMTMGNFLAALTASQLLWTLVSAVIGLVVISVIVAITESSVDGMVYLLAALMAGAVICSFILFYYPLVFVQLIPGNRLKSFFKQCAKAISIWHPNSRLLWWYVATSCGLFLSFALKIWFSFRILGLEISILEACFFQACIAVGFTFSLVPGNLGLKEGVLVGLSALFQIDAESALVAALIDRTAILLPTLVLGPMFLQRLGRNI